MRPGAGKIETLVLQGHQAFVVLPPDSRAPGRPQPWVWYAPTLPGLPDKHEAWMVDAWLAAGVAIAGIDVGESFGNPAGRSLYSALYDELVGNRGFSPKPCLLVRSRGGLMLYNWAAEHPGLVAGVAGIYPVCNLSSYPGLERASKAYGMTPAALQESLAEHNPIDRLAGLAAARVPILHIHGDSDTVVPIELNSGELARRYRKLGGPATVIVAKGQGHNFWEGFFRCRELTDFVIARATGTTDQGRSPVRVEENHFILNSTGEAFAPRGFK